MQAGFIVLFWMIVWIVPVQAETIFLKNGDVIEGQIIERAKDYISVEVSGRRQKFTTGQILRIVEEGKSIFDATEMEKEREKAQARKKELIRRLLEAMNVPASLNRLFLRLSREAPEEAQAKIRQILKTDILLERIIPIYDKHYTESELEDLIEFYSSPIGKKHLSTTPTVMEETMKECMQYFKAQSANAEK